MSLNASTYLCREFVKKIHLRGFLGLASLRENLDVAVVSNLRQPIRDVDVIFRIKNRADVDYKSPERVYIHNK